ncbi:hypothetical protein C5S39_09245 [Candidatus Methanophagaceae archaeon]|jgi:hypothetical protein|nr:hypothetical protein C5S39_09245 [Methanophagales archaeon]
MLSSYDCKDIFEHRIQRYFPGKKVLSKKPFFGQIIGGTGKEGTEKSVSRM